MLFRSAYALALVVTFGVLFGLRVFDMNGRTVVPLAGMIVGNSKIFGDNIKNFSANAYRRVDLSAQLAHSVDTDEAVARLKAAVSGVANVLATPAPDIEILSFSERGPVLAVRPYCNTAHYWQVYFDTNRAIRDTFSAAGYPVPEAHQVMRTAVDEPMVRAA